MKAGRRRSGIIFRPIARPSDPPLLLPAPEVLVLFAEPPALLTVTEPDNAADGVTETDAWAVIS